MKHNSVEHIGDVCKRRGKGDKPRADHGKYLPALLFRMCDQLHGIAEVRRRVHVCGADFGNPFAMDFGGVGQSAEGKPGKNHDFARRVKPLHIGGGVLFGVAPYLRLPQCRVKIHAPRDHLR